MDIISVFFILSVSVAGTAFMTWVPAYRKGVRNGVQAEKARIAKHNAKMVLNSTYGKRGIVLDVNSLYPSEYVYDPAKDGE